MSTVIVGPLPPEVSELIERRRRLGIDGHDEVWEGVYHMVPYAHSRHGLVEAQLIMHLGPLVEARGMAHTAAFNLGEDDISFRVPDFGIHAEPPDALFVPTALVVGEVLSPHDETFEKIPYYRALSVAELWVVGPERRSVDVHHVRAGGVSHWSDVLGLDVDDSLTRLISWPP